MFNKEKITWCPTMAGTYFAYAPEWFTPDGKWETIPTKHQIDPTGVNVPETKYLGGLSGTIGLLGYEAAMTISWGCAAQAAAIGDTIKVRVQAYEVVYDIKARKVDMPEEPDK